ncbi:MAG TPA: methyltransferase domain-containing protein [Thermoanaerobaculia bacterium]|nr:methyltransferase domain-containing protein [Thermoanaerobaculia bacterium]
MGFIRALIVLHRVYGRRPLRDRVHTLVRFLTCPMLRVLDAVPHGAVLLDIGAGHGVFATLAHARGARRVVGVEPDMRKVRPIGGVESVIGLDDVVKGTFDAISIIDVLYKIPIADWDALLIRCRERLASGGTLIIKEQDPTARIKNAWNALQERIASTLNLTLGESFTYESPAAFLARLTRLGFVNARSKRIDFGYPHPHVLYVAKKA